MKKLSSIILSGLAPITILTTTSLTTSCNGKLPKLIHDPNVYFRTPAIAQDVIVIDLKRFDKDLQDDINTTFQSLEGLIVQQNQKAEIFVKSGVAERDRWLDVMQAKYHFNTRVIDKIEEGEGSIWSVLADYKGYFNSKFVKYKKANAESEGDDRNDISINNATMVSACDHLLMVSDKLLEASGGKYALILKGIGIEEETEGWRPIYTTAYQTFRNYEEQLNKTMLLNQDPVDFALRDYAIAAKIPTVCVGLEKENRDKIANKMKANSPIFGWSHGFDGSVTKCGPEQDYLVWATSHKFNVLASDHCYNLSFYSYDRTNKPYKQYHQEKIKADPNKHYLAIVMSDGDNIQWMQNDFLTSEKYWGSDARGSFPISWTISPSPIDLNNSILEEMYKTATHNDEIIAGPSGYSYINPAWYWQNSLKDSYYDFAKRTAGYMHDCDLSVANVLDFQYPGYDPDDPEPQPRTDPICMTPYMQQNQIKGLVWSLDGLSLDGHGSIDWINDKPLLSFREGIWDNEYLHRDKVLERLKTYPRNPKIIDGYTALVVNVWAEEGKMNKINEFVNQLPNDVELVTISQLLQLIKDNVSHVHAVPTQYPVPSEN